MSGGSHGLRIHSGIGWCISVSLLFGIGFVIPYMLNLIDWLQYPDGA